ncbi:MAG: hypothetical protein IJE09_06385 [Oscillospiraceae bacterium]|nr:hypothetical protein [Oscillospiraceae bacterium]
MEKKKIDLGAIAGEAGKNTKSLLGKAKDNFINMVDQNDDGEFDMEDVSAFAETIGNATRSALDAVKAGAEGKSRAIERNALNPIFSEDIDSTDFMLSKLIRLTEIDKKRAESEVCQGSIGFISYNKELKIINIFREKVSEFGLSFFPDTDGELYYVDPSDRDRYIALDDYFSYLKVVRINELQKIAQDLGAKHFKVVYKECENSSAGTTVKAKAGIKIGKAKDGVDTSHELKTAETSKSEIAAEMDCPGHAPVEPKLCYLQKDPSVQNLIALRMDKDSPLQHHKLTIAFSNSSGIKAKDAVKIDAALKALKIGGNTTIASEVQNESRKFLEYEIDF